MRSRRRAATFIPVTLIFLGALIAGALLVCSPARAQTNPKSNQPAANDNAPPSGKFVSSLPRGTKLMLKDGSYELVSQYVIQGDRVRYYDVDNAQWEVIPTSIVDWEATRKEEAQEEKNQASLLTKAEKQEDEQRAVPALDIDASLEVAPGIFLPPGEGLFVFNGKSVAQVPQARTSSALSKTHFVERVLVPVPIIPSRHTLEIPGEHAKFRLSANQPEFYLRTKGGLEPDVLLLRAKIHHGDRHIMNLDSLMGQEHDSGDTLPMQTWEIARDVYRYTLAQKLPRGEYVIAEMVPNQGMSMYVWDFGVN